MTERDQLEDRETTEEMHRTDANRDPALGPDRRASTSTPPGTPRWVKVFGIIFIILVLLIVILHLTGLSFGGHGGGHTLPASVIVYGVQ